MTKTSFVPGAMFVAVTAVLLMPGLSQAQAHRFGRGGLDIRLPGNSSAQSAGSSRMSVGSPRSRSNTLDASQAAPQTYDGQAPASGPAFGAGRSAQINVQVPPGAEVWFDDHTTQQHGRFRS